MCVEYALKANETEIQNEFGVAIKNVSKKDAWKTRVKMTVPAPVIAVKDGEIRMNELVFRRILFPMRVSLNRRVIRRKRKSRLRTIRLFESTKFPFGRRASKSFRASFL